MDNPALKALLRFAVEHTKDEDAKEDSNFKELDKEKREFLEKVLKSMTVDVIKELEAAINALESDNTKKDEKLNALNVIREEIDNIDFANSFVKVGGTSTLLKYVNSDDSDLRSVATYIVAEMAQNNPYCQQHFLESDLLKSLLTRLENDGEIAAAHAISAIIKCYEPALTEFSKIGGLPVLLSCLDRLDERTKSKIVFLIASLSSQNETIRDEFVEKNAVSTLMPLLETSCEYNAKSEHIAYALSELSKSEKWNPTEAESNNLKSIVNALIANKKGFTENEECLSYAQNVLENLKLH